MNESKAPYRNAARRADQPDAGQSWRTVLGFGKLESSIAGTYHVLRLALFLLAFLLPFHLVVLGRWWWDVPFQNSLSAYYHAEGGELRDWFVGYLCAVGLLLVVYCGFTWSENWALNFGGVCLVVVALVPTGSSAWHGAAAIAFFCAGAYVSFFEAQTTVTPQLIKSATRRRFYRALYPLLSCLMLLAVALTVFFWFRFDPSKLTLVLEWAGVWAFGLYWLLKTIELWQSAAEANVMRGDWKRVRNPNLSWRNLSYHQLERTDESATE